MGSTLNGTHNYQSKQDDLPLLSYDPIISSKRDLTSRGVAPFNQKVATSSNLSLLMRYLLVLLIYRDDAIALLFICPSASF